MNSKIKETKPFRLTVESIRTSNSKMMSGAVRSITRDKRGASTSYVTPFGVRTLSISRNTMTRAISLTMKFRKSKKIRVSEAELNESSVMPAAVIK